MDQHTPPHVRAPAPVDGVAVMPEPVLKYSDTGYSPEQFPFLASDWLADDFQKVVYGGTLRMFRKWEESAFHREVACLLYEAVGTYDDPETSHKALQKAWINVDTWLRNKAAQNAATTPVDHAYRFVALELQHAMRVLPDPFIRLPFTDLDVIRDLVNPVVARGTLNGKQVALRAGEDWDQAIEKQSPLPKPVNVIPADQVKPKRIRGVANVYRALFDQARSSSQACTTTIPEPDPKFVEVHPVQLSSQIVPDLSS